MKKITGNLEAFFESGSEGIQWCIYMDNKKGYDALHYIESDDYITIYDEENSVIYEGDIIKDNFSNWQPYPMNPMLGQQVAGDYYVHWVQANVDPDLWSEWFNKRLKAEITKSNLSNDQRELIKKSIIDNYYKNIELSDAVLTKSKLLINLKEPKHYNEEGTNAVSSILFSSVKRYQIIDGCYYTIIILEDELKHDVEIKKEDICEELFYKLNILKDEYKIKKLKEYVYFQRDHVKNNFEKHINIVFGNIKDEAYMEEFKKSMESFDFVKSSLGEEFLEEIKNAKNYKINNHIFKLVKFDKELTELLRNTDFM